MNLESRSLCEDQHQALNTYLDALLSLPEEMSTLPKAAPATSLIPDAPAPVAGASLKCFVFTVAGLKLALPLARVTEIVEFSGCGGTPVPPLLLGHPNLVVAHAAVRWRTPLTQRRWLAGTLLQHRCALLDADEIYQGSTDNTL